MKKPKGWHVPAKANVKIKMNAPPRSDRFWDRQSAVLLAALVLIASSRLAVTNWVKMLTLTQVLSFFGVLLGLALGYSLFPRRASIWLAFGYGFFLIPLQLLNILQDRSEWVWDDLLILFTRLFDSLVLFFKNQPITDPIFFLTLMCVVFWNLGVYSAYQLTRHENFLRAVLPGALAMLIIQIYDVRAAARIWGFALYIFLSLLLMGRMNYLRSQTGWRRKRVFFTSEMEGDISRVAFTVAAIAVFAAWIFPSALNSIEPAARAWNEFAAPFRERFESMFDALENTYTIPVPRDYYGEELALSSVAPTSEQPVFYVKLDRVESRPVRYYWRGRVYDQYINGRWVTSELDTMPFNPERDVLSFPYPLQGANASFTITMNFPKQELLYAPPGTNWTNLAGEWMTAPATDSAPDQFAWLAARALTAGEAYQLRAQLPNPTEVQLRAAGEKYPDWVRARYLQIPKEIQPQIQSLALQITAGEQTPYDKAQAITAFLRNEIEYVTELQQTPPEGYDPALWVLLDYKKGFCLYYASSQVLLLRSIGIPARMAVGFAQGKYDSLGSRYLVTYKDAHAWPEVYFPEIGWVEFEPTGNQPPLARPTGIQTGNETEEKSDLLGRNLPVLEDELETPPAPVPPAQETSPSAGITLADVFTRLYPFLLAGFVLLSIFAIQKYSLVDRLPLYLEERYAQSGRKPPNWLRRWAHWAGLNAMQRMFHIVDWSLRLLGKPQPLQATPRERAAALAALLPKAQDAVAQLQKEHETALFSNRPPQMERARRAAGKILFEAIFAKMTKK